MAVASVSYDFQVMEIFRGPGTGPMFFKTIHANFFTDAISLKGRYLFTPSESNSSATNQSNDYTYVKTNWDKTFVGAGAEIRLSTTLTYHVPVDFIIGGYYGFDLNATGGFSPFITLSIGGFGPLGKKKNKFQTLLN